MEFSINIVEHKRFSRFMRVANGLSKNSVKPELDGADVTVQGCSMELRATNGHVAICTSVLVDNVDGKRVGGRVSLSDVKRLSRSRATTNVVTFSIEDEADRLPLFTFQNGVTVGGHVLDVESLTGALKVARRCDGVRSTKGAVELSHDGDHTLSVDASDFVCEIESDPLMQGSHEAWSHVVDCKILAHALKGFDGVVSIHTGSGLFFHVVDHDMVATIATIIRGATVERAQEVAA